MRNRSSAANPCTEQNGRNVTREPMSTASRSAAIPSWIVGVRTCWRVFRLYPGKDASRRRKYLDALAYLLSQNQIPPGIRNLRRRLFLRSSWLDAIDPSRCRPMHSSKCSPIDVVTAMTKPLGTPGFELLNLTDVSAFPADANRGHKVVVKGVLGRRGNAMRINVLSAGSVTPDCKP